ncbi:MAG: TonB-dependent receptor [Paludibacteraceae bacterium]|nr:TonB-dependent receptor [Paludibacteraceae bacterium]
MHFDFSVKFLMSLMLAPVSVYGSLPDSVSSHTNIPEVVVTGENHAPVPTTNTSQTINLKKSDCLVLQSVSDAVRRMAGAEIKDYGGIGGLKTVSVRGLGAKHTTVTYDGIAINDCQNGQVDLGRFSLDQLDKITLAIGEDANILRPASHFASASVLELQTVLPDYSDKNFNATAKINAGSFGLFNPYLSFDHKLGARNSIKASADFFRADGMYPYTLTNGKLKTEEIRRHSATAGGHAELSSAFYLSPKSQLKAKAYYYVSDRELPGGVIYYNTESNEMLKDKNAFAQAQFRTDWEKTTLLVNGKFNWSTCYYHDEAMMYPGGKLDNRYFQREWYGTAVVRHNFTEHFSMANATDYILNSFNSNIHGCVFPQRHTLLDALSGKFKNEKVTATATLLGSFFFNQVEIGEAPDNYQHLSPSIAVSYKPFAPSIYFRASYKNIFRMPNFNELYFNSFGVRTLEPEKTKQYNVGATYLYESDKSVESSRLKSFAISADYYFNKVDDKIVAMPKMFIWSIVNMGYVEIKGVDFATNLEVATSERTSLFFTAKYAYQYAVDLTDPKSDIYTHQLPYIPKHSGNGSVAFENPVVNVSYNVNAVGKRYYLPQNIRPNMMEAYAEHGVSLYKTFDFKKFDMKLRGDVVNLTDKQYEVVRFYPMPKRSYKASVEFKF